MFLKPGNRWQAFGLHILISLVLFMVLVAVIYFCWYPGLLFRHDGGLEGVKLIAGVDFFIGPVLTLMVYKIGKKSLPFDLACIALFQAICLTGGMWTVWNTRPVAVVYAMGTFTSIPYQVYKDYGVNPDDVALLRGRWPVWLAVDLSLAEEAALRSEVPAKGMIITKAFYDTAHYVPLAQAKESLARYGKLPGAIVDFPGQRAGEEMPAGENIRYFYAGLGGGAGYMAVDISTGEAAGFVMASAREKSLLDRVSQAKVAAVKFFNSLRQ